MLYGHVYAFFGEMLIRSSAHCFYCVVCFFDIDLQKLLSRFGDEFLVGIFICKFFFHFAHSLFLSFMVSLAAQMLLMLIRYQLSYEGNR